MSTIDASPIKVRAVFEGPFRIAGDAWSRRLIGARCRECGTTVLSPRLFCPHCWSAGTQDAVELSDHGTLYSYTIVRNPPNGVPGPYAIAYVDLPEKVRLMVRAASDLDPAWVGKDVAIDVDQIGVDEDGTVVVGPTVRGLAASGDGR